MLEGKIAVVTGASRGIGKAVAIKLASQGATVVINYNGSKEKAKAVRETIVSAGGKAEYEIIQIDQKNVRIFGLDDV